jgi:hypothetical protein
LDISDVLDQINGDPLGGNMDGMDDMNAPMPPMDADTPPMGDDAPPMDDNVPPPPMDDPAGQEPGGAPGEEEQDPMPGDPNALSAGNPDPNADAGAGGDIQSKYDRLSPDQQKAADKYIDSMMNNESRFNFKHIIDEVFGERDGNVNPMDGVTRPEKKAAKEAVTKEIDPYKPR